MLRWLYAEALGIFAPNAVALAGHRLTSNRCDWLIKIWARERLAEDVVPMHQMQVLSRAVDGFLAGVLSKLNVPPHIQAEAVGAFLPMPPDWVDTFLELVERLASDPITSRELPRHVDQRRTPNRCLRAAGVKQRRTNTRSTGADAHSASVAGPDASAGRARPLRRSSAGCG
jgi:hypothetical protein